MGAIIPCDPVSFTVTPELPGKKTLRNAIMSIYGFSFQRFLPLMILFKNTLT